MSVSPVATTEKALPLALWLGAAFILIAAAFPLPYGYYTFVRLATCLACAVLAWWSWRRAPTWALALAVVAVAFNPIFPLHLPKSVWRAIDLAAAVLIVVHMFFVRGIKNEHSAGPK